MFTGLEIRIQITLGAIIWLTTSSLVGQMVKNLPTSAGNQVQSLGQENPLEKGMATHSSIPAWRIPWTEEPGGLRSMGHKESDMTERLTFSHQVLGP